MLHSFIFPFSDQINYIFLMMDRAENSAKFEAFINMLLNINDNKNIINPKQKLYKSSQLAH